MDALQHHNNISVSKTVLREMISRFSIFIVLVTDEDLAWQIHRTEFFQRFHQKRMGTVCFVWGQAHSHCLFHVAYSTLSGLRGSLICSFWLWRKILKRSIFVLYARISFRFSSHLSINVASASFEALKFHLKHMNAWMRLLPCLESSSCLEIPLGQSPNELTATLCQTVKIWFNGVMLGYISLFASLPEFPKNIPFPLKNVCEVKSHFTAFDSISWMCWKHISDLSPYGGWLRFCFPWDSC